MRVKKSQVVLSGLVILVSLSEAPVARDVDMLTASTASSEQLMRSEEAQKRDVRRATAVVGRGSVQEDDSSSLPPPPGPYSSEVTPAVSELEMTTFREPKPVFAPRPAYESAASHSRSESALRPFGPADSFGGPRTLLPGQSGDFGAMPRARMSSREGNQAVGLPFPSTPRRSTASVDWHGPAPSYGRRDVPNPPMIGSVQNWPEYPRPRPSKVTQGPKLPDYYWYTQPYAVSQASGYGYRDGTMGSTYPAPGYPHYPRTYNAPGGFFAGTPSTGSFEQSGYRVPGYSYPAPLPEYGVDMPPVRGSEGWWDAVSAGYAAPAAQLSPSEMGGYRSGPQRHHPYQWPAYDPAYATAEQLAGIQQNPLDRQQSTYPSYTEYGYGLVPGLEGYTHTQDSVSHYRGKAGSASPISTYHGYGGGPSAYLPASPRYGTPAEMQEHTIPISSLPGGPKAGVEDY